MQMSVCVSGTLYFTWVELSTYVRLLKFLFTLLKLNLIKFIYEIQLEELTHLEMCPGPGSGILIGPWLDKGNWGRKKNPIGDILSSSEDSQFTTESYRVPRHDLYSLQASV